LYWALLGYDFFSSIFKDSGLAYVIIIKASKWRKRCCAGRGAQDDLRASTVDKRVTTGGRLVG
jgi:hypothetical protein